MEFSTILGTFSLFKTQTTDDYVHGPEHEKRRTCENITFISPLNGKIHSSAVILTFLYTSPFRVTQTEIKDTFKKMFLFNSHSRRSELQSLQKV
jgi:hypothetical protein